MKINLIINTMSLYEDEEDDNDEERRKKKKNTKI